MVLLLEFLAVVLPLVYALLCGAYALVFFRDEPAVARALKPTLTTVLLLHALYVVLRIMLFRHFPLATVFESLTMIAFALVFVYWIIERIVRNQNTGVFVLGLVFLFQTVSSAFIGHEGPINPILRSAWFGIHTTTAVVGYAAFALSAVYGTLYLMLHHELKASRFGIIYGRLPSLDTLATMHERAVLVGLVALTGAVVVGIGWLPRVFGWMLTDPKVLLTVTIWVLYLLVVLAQRYGWMSRSRLIYVSIVGFIFLVFSTIAVNLWLHSFHAFT